MIPNLTRQIEESIEVDIDFWVEQKHADDCEQLEWEDHSWSD